MSNVTKIRENIIIITIIIIIIKTRRENRDVKETGKLDVADTTVSVAPELTLTWQQTRVCVCARARLRQLLRWKHNTRPTVNTHRIAAPLAPAVALRPQTNNRTGRKNRTPLTKASIYGNEPAPLSTEACGTERWRWWGRDDVTHHMADLPPTVPPLLRLRPAGGIWCRAATYGMLFKTTLITVKRHCQRTGPQCGKLKPLWLLPVYMSPYSQYYRTNKNCMTSVGTTCGR